MSDSKCMHLSTYIDGSDPNTCVVRCTYCREEMRARSELSASKPGESLLSLDIDAECKTLAVVIKSLAPFTEYAQARIIKYCVERLGVTL